MVRLSTIMEMQQEKQECSWAWEHGKGEKKKIQIN